ncbi:F-box/LRR-repeat protein 13 [Citrus sinensis]|uniref:F-box/LRR-repeat protein 13 n=1 Tax=Citrus sinensis TaxID=2711 RepID=A0ACB8JVX3_CITSI|nr:F-box/LRR-repeat protein 13 [Citrus sinensis]
MNQKNVDKDNARGDITSRLPDHLLCRILSCLPTEDAVRTCILSSRWRDLWTSIHGLYFDGGNEKSRSWFLNFVERVLGLCQLKDIHNFHLRSSTLREKDFSRVSEWICFAIQRNVRHLFLDVYSTSNFTRHKRILELPQSILTCETLVELKLCSDIVIDIPGSGICFPSLKILHFGFCHPDRGLMQKFFSSCPTLEELTIEGILHPRDNVQTINIIVQTLKRLSISVFVMQGYVSERIFEIRTPNLEYLSIIANSLAYFVLDEIPFLKKAFVLVEFNVLRRNSSGIFENDARSALELVKRIKSMKILSLPDSMTVLSFVLNNNLPTFSNLISLELHIDSCFGWKLLTPFLKSSPSLKVLNLDFSKAHKLTPNTLQDIVFEDLVCVEPECAPHCLSSCVEVIEITNLKREDYELEMVRYLLENSKVLEKFSVGFAEDAPEDNLRKEILMFPRGSKTCNIEFC